MMKWINDGVALLTGAMIGALLMEAAHVREDVGGAIVWIIVAAGFYAIVDGALNGPLRFALALNEISTRLESRIKGLESTVEKMSRRLEKNVLD
ncbi:MAG: hypothetical protein ABSG46_18015 [Candidatus Binataceae bacterium]|jgi:hypothetical protein